MSADMRVNAELVTPEMATRWLQGMAPNRKLKRSQVDELKASMLGGQWVQNGDTIKFGKDGRLIDGQARLTALVEAEMTLPLFCAFNVANVAIDSFLPRRRVAASG